MSDTYPPFFAPFDPPWFTDQELAERQKSPDLLDRLRARVPASKPVKSVQTPVDLIAKLRARSQQETPREPIETFDLATWEAISESRP